MQIFWMKYSTISILDDNTWEDLSDSKINEFQRIHTGEQPQMILLISLIIQLQKVYLIDLLPQHLKLPEVKLVTFLLLIILTKKLSLMKHTQILFIGAK